MELQKDFYNEDLVFSERIWIAESGYRPDYSAGPRIGIDYAGDPWKDMPWRFLLNL